MTSDVQPLAKLQRPAARLWPLFAVEIFGSVGGNLLQLGIFFYMHRRFGWEARANLLLSAGQGAIYIAGALSASHLVKRFGRVGVLRGAQVAGAILALIGFSASSPALICAVVLAYSATLATQWPALESLVVSGTSVAELSRRISVYNMVWSAVGAIVIAVTGTIIANLLAGVFLFALASHVLSEVALLWAREPAPEEERSHGPPDPKLLAKRELAMHLSRIALPATYAAIYALGALLPTLRSIQGFPEQTRTIVASVWMIARFFAFVLLGFISWWQTRPRVLFFAAIGLLAAFVWTALWGNATGMIAGQVVLGISMGIIYCGSLYFGMVLSEGSTGQGGYHEAVIGLGSILGPGSGAIAEFLQPGDQRGAICAVALIILISVVACGWLTLRFTWRQYHPTAAG